MGNQTKNSGRRRREGHGGPEKSSVFVLHVTHLEDVIVVRREIHSLFSSSLSALGPSRSGSHRWNEESDCLSPSLLFSSSQLGQMPHMAQVSKQASAHGYARPDPLLTIEKESRRSSLTVSVSAAAAAFLCAPRRFLLLVASSPPFRYADNLRRYNQADVRPAAATNNQLHPHFPEGENGRHERRVEWEEEEKRRNWERSNCTFVADRLARSGPAGSCTTCARALKLTAVSRDHSPSFPSALEEKRTQSPVS